MYYVIGSGPAGTACAQALVEAGAPVTILDPGLTPEPERQIHIDALGRHDEPDWSAGELALAAPAAVPAGRGAAIPTKLVHGSDYPYRAVPGASELRQSDGLNLQGSCAAGGLSNVWGGAILPYRQADLAGWPISVADLELGFTRIANLLPVAGEADGLAELFPLYGAAPTPLRQSRQAQRFMRRLSANRAKLEAAGVAFGASRLAVDAAGAENRACIYCARCLHGCPRDLIYSSRQSLKLLISQGKVIYRRGVCVRSIHERDDRLEIHAIGPDDAPSTFEADRVFLAAGVLYSTAILLRSLNRFDRPVTIRDSQYFIFPLLQFSAAPDVTKEQLHTLCQIFLEVYDREISHNLIHLQIYSYNDHVASMLDEKLGHLKVLFPREALLGRLLIVQGYLHSDHSPSIRATLKQNGESDALHLELVENAQTKSTIARLLRKLRGLTFAMGATPLDPLLKIADPGRGFHSGGSFPMTDAPGPGQTDRLGRPFGLTRLHAVDATTFPNIPAPTITFTVMANAYRIGRAASTLDRGEAQ
jgi:choline dehydrogenase-like flavoprotein